TSSYSETGVLGDAEKATKEKGERAYNEAVKQLCNFVKYFRERPIDTRHAEQVKRTMPIPWGQRDLQ
ncbi:MAG: creatininase family protein, partial [Planctomycetes bacterium]|nr:creatininase family protein [Planctomycetota bacterium]